MQKISFVIPCYRSEHTLAAVHEELTATMQTLPQYDYEVVLINDCSPDDTIGTIRRLVAADAHVQGVDLAKNFGQHAALMAGFHQCTGDIIVCLDDDGQTPANEVGKLLDKINEGYDVVYASYDNKRQAGWRNLWLFVSDLHHYRPLRPRRCPHGLGVHHGAAAVVGRHDPAGAGPDRRVRRPHLHVCQRRPAVCGKGVYQA